MEKKTTPIGWANTLTSLTGEVKFLWSLVMTIENSPLRKLDPMAAHMIFQTLAFVWSGIFGLMVGSIWAVGISGIAHVLFIAGIVITATTFRQADQNPNVVNKMFTPRDNVTSGRMNGGEHE